MAQAAGGRVPYPGAMSRRLLFSLVAASALAPAARAGEPVAAAAPAAPSWRSAPVTAFLQWAVGPSAAPAPSMSARMAALDAQIESARAQAMRRVRDQTDFVYGRTLAKEAARASSPTMEPASADGGSRAAEALFDGLDPEAARRSLEAGQRLLNAAGVESTIVPHEDFPVLELGAGSGPSALGRVLSSRGRRDIERGLGAAMSVRVDLRSPTPYFNERADGSVLNLDPRTVFESLGKEPAQALLHELRHAKRAADWRSGHDAAGRVGFFTGAAKDPTRGYATYFSLDEISTHFRDMQRLSGRAADDHGRAQAFWRLSKADELSSTAASMLREMLSLAEAGKLGVQDDRPASGEALVWNPARMGDAEGKLRFLALEVSRSAASLEAGIEARLRAALSETLSYRRRMERAADRVIAGYDRVMAALNASRQDPRGGRGTPPRPSGSGPA